MLSWKRSKSTNRLSSTGNLVIESQDSLSATEQMLGNFKKRAKIKVANHLQEGVMVELRESDGAQRAISSAGINVSAGGIGAIGGHVNMESVSAVEVTSDIRYIDPNNDTTFEVTNKKQCVVRVQTEYKTVFEARRVMAGKTRTLRVLPKHVPP